MTEVRYERLVTEPQAVATELAGTLDVPADAMSTALAAAHARIGGPLAARPDAGAARRRRGGGRRPPGRAVSREPDKNVVGGVLLECSTDPLTGFYRDGCCATGPEDVGSHTVCCVATAEFLEFSRRAGNDLSTPRPEWGFPGVAAR